MQDYRLEKRGGHDSWMTLLGRVMLLDCEPKSTQSHILFDSDAASLTLKSKSYDPEPISNHNSNKVHCKKLSYKIGDCSYILYIYIYIYYETIDNRLKFK